MIDWSLAIRNLLRNRRRSLSTLLALALGLTAILLYSGFQANLGATMLTAVVRAGGHLQVQHRDYFLYGGGNPTAYGIANYQPLVEAILNDPELAKLVTVATPMLKFGGLAGNFEAGVSRPVIGTGFEAVDVNRMRKWNEFSIPVERPGFPLAGEASDAAIVGVGVARVLQLCKPLGLDNCPQPERETITRPAAPGAALPSDVAALAESEHAVSQKGPRFTGARVELLSTSARGTPNVTALNVVAAEDQIFKELDEVAVILNLAHAQNLVFGRAAARATAVMVLLNHSADLDKVATNLRVIVGRHSGGQPLVVRTFGELNPFYVQSEQLFDFIFQFIFVLIGGIVLFTVGNTMNTAVVERTVEIGTLRAIGLRQSGIRRLFVIEGFILGCIGAATGIVLAIVIGEIVNRTGLTWLPPGSSERLPLRLRVLADSVTVFGTTIGLVLIATASAWWPSWRAANLNVVEALRHA